MAIDFEGIFQRALENVARRANEPVLVDSKVKSNNTDPKKRYFRHLSQEDLTIGSKASQATEEEDN